MAVTLSRAEGSLRAAGVAVAVLLSAGWAAAASPAADIAALTEQDRLPAAADAARQWAAEEPGNTDALRVWGQLAYEIGRYSEAEDALRSLLFYTPHDPDLLLKLGDALLHRGMHAEARLQFEAAIHLGAGCAEAYVGLARVALVDSEDLGDVLSAAEVALSVGPDYAPAHAVMGGALRAMGRYADALSHLRHARKIGDGDPATLFELGLTWELLGDEVPARRAWERFVQLEPFAPETWLIRNNLVVTAVEEIIDRGFNASYSPDGSRIAYRSRGPGGWNIFTIPAEGVPVETSLWATEDTVQSLAWSPDSASIAVNTVVRFTDNEGNARWSRKVILVPADGGEVRELLDERQLGEVAWNPVNGRIGVRHHQAGEGWRIIEVDPESAEFTPIPVADRRSPHYSPQWSADGSKLLAVRRSPRLPDGTFAYDLLVGPADDFANATAIFRSGDLPSAPIFTPDGSAIIFALPGPVDQRLNFWAVPSDGSREPVLVDHMVGPQGSASLSPDGRYLLTMRGLTLVRATLAGLNER